MLNMDVRDEFQVQQVIQQIVERIGRIDVVVNNAGLGMVGAVELSNDLEVRSLFETNVFGVLNFCRHTIPVMRHAGYGYVINVTSMAGRMGLPFRGIYCATKSAVEGFSEAMSMELKQFNIHVVILEPGDFKTNIDQHRVEVERAVQPSTRCCINRFWSKSIERWPKRQLLSHSGFWSRRLSTIRSRDCATVLRKSCTMQRFSSDGFCLIACSSRS